MPVKHDESSLKSALMRELRLTLPKFVALRHEDVRTCGIPDLSLTGLGRTTWWEFKHANPRFESQGVQELTMLRLAACGYARYVVWEEDANGGAQRTLIVHPKKMQSLEPEDACGGFNMKFVARFMQAAHEGGRR